MISKEGEVGFFDAGGSRMEEVKIGGLIPRTYTIVTGANSQMVGLLSNGTLITLVEKTRMRVQTFQQEPFDPQGKKLKDLKEEPSGSKVELELDMGSLIVSTKKLDRQSSFDINSPLGTAGIRGTEFQMALDPSGGAVGCDGIHCCFLPAGWRATDCSERGKWFERHTNRYGHPETGQSDRRPAYLQHQSGSNSQLGKYFPQ